MPFFLGAQLSPPDPVPAGRYGGSSQSRGSQYWDRAHFNRNTVAKQLAKFQNVPMCHFFIGRQPLIIGDMLDLASPEVLNNGIGRISTAI